ncbi:hypothetical protein BD413DRAFT_608650 [Trametes elegans]|nr:hypothetical protein BD413DRAFT_608650 [Trametes elegans]
MALLETRSDASDGQPLEVDGALYVAGGAPTDGQMRWEKLRMLIQFREGDQANDPYDGSQGAASADERNELLEEIADFNAKVIERGHRLAIYVLVVTGTKARVTRWDRSGSIYTDAFDYVKRPTILRDLLWEFSLLSAEKQGFDPTVMAVSPEEHMLMNTLANEHPDGLSDKESTEAPPRAPDDPPYVFAYWPRWKTSIEVSRERREFLAGMPQVLLPRLVGRGTHGYVAYDCKDKRFVWLKDTWRPDYAREGQVLEILAAAGVKNIPTLFCHGDVGHATETPRFAKCPRTSNGQKQQDAVQPPEGAHRPVNSDRVMRFREGPTTAELADPFREDKGVQSLQHYRVVLSEVCLPLEDFLCDRELVVMVRDALIGNILIYPRVVARKNGTCYVSRGGLLGEWELGKKPVGDANDDTDASGPQAVRTWQFLSAYALNHPLEPMKIPDDLEWFFHILLYCGVRHVRHHYMGSTQWFLSEFFHAHTPYGDGGLRHCGLSKSSAMHRGRIFSFPHDLIFLNDDGTRHNLDGIIEVLLSWFWARYKLATPSKAAT